MACFSQLTAYGPFIEDGVGAETEWTDFPSLQLTSTPDLFAESIKAYLSRFVDQLGCEYLEEVFPSLIGPYNFPLMLDIESFISNIAWVKESTLSYNNALTDIADFPAGTFVPENILVAEFLGDNTYRTTIKAGITVRYRDNTVIDVIFGMVHERIDRYIQVSEGIMSGEVLKNDLTVTELVLPDLYQRGGVAGIGHTSRYISEYYQELGDGTASASDVQSLVGLYIDYGSFLGYPGNSLKWECAAPDACSVSPSGTPQRTKFIRASDEYPRAVDLPSATSIHFINQTFPLGSFLK